MPRRGQRGSVRFAPRRGLDPAGLALLSLLGARLVDAVTGWDNSNYKEMERYAKINKEGGDHHLFYESGN